MLLRFRSRQLTRFGLFMSLALLVAFTMLAISGRATSLVGSAHWHLATSDVVTTENQTHEPNLQPERRQSFERGHELRHHRAMQSRSIAAESHDHGFVALHHHTSDNSAKWVDEAAHAASSIIDKDSEKASLIFIVVPALCADFNRVPSIQRVSTSAPQKPASITGERIERPPMNLNL